LCRKPQSSRWSSCRLIAVSVQIRAASSLEMGVDPANEVPLLGDG
jgi:hypothetical protein